MNEVQNNDLIKVNSNCVGCNRCIRECSILGALVAEKTADGNNYLHIDSEKCIACGSCIKVCEHQAKEYIDDTELLFKALEAGENITILVSPSFFANYADDYGTILGGLKKLGAKHIFNAGFGTDITLWGYISYLKQNNFTSGISQHCPTIVGYIERYQPKLIPKLFPIQSPMMCSAIYVRNEMNITDKLAYIGPCIAQKEEQESLRGQGLISYNVTFEQLLTYVRKHNISGPSLVDEIEQGAGSYCPFPDGIKENISWYLKEGTFIRHVEGSKNIYNFLRLNEDVILSDHSPYSYIDLLSCTLGCSYGPATEIASIDDERPLIARINIKNAQLQREEVKNLKHLSIENRFEELNKRFKDMKLSDYTCSYTDRSGPLELSHPTESELEDVFLGKIKKSLNSRQINCSNCGYPSCNTMAHAIYHGFNHKENCVIYVKEVVEKEKEKARKAELYKELAMRDVHTGMFNRNGFYNWINEQKTFDNIAIVNFDLNDLKKCNDTYGHAIGDQYIQCAADIIINAFCEYGTSYRVGGDEFCTIIENATEELVQECFKKMKYVEEEYNKYQEQIKIRIASGHAIYNPELDNDFADTQKRADMKMYQDKLELKSNLPTEHETA